jgi:hypothetical protein
MLLLFLHLARRERSALPPLLGVVFAAAVIAALARLRIAAPGTAAGRGLLGGVAIAAALAEMAGRVDGRMPVVALASVPGTIIVAGSVPGVPSWMRVVVALVGAEGGALLADFDRRHARLGVAAVCLLLTAGGIYAAVPDTEAARALVGVAVVLAWCGWPFPIARIGFGGSVAVATTTAWVIIDGGRGRPGSIIGAAAALGVVLLEPVVRYVFGAAAEARRPSHMFVGARLVAVQLATALAAARFVGLTRSASAALARTAVLAPIAFVLTLWSRPPDDG